MSAETLRKAAARIRHDVEFGQAHGDDAFLLAVADWLETEAVAHEVHMRQVNDFGDEPTPRVETHRGLAVARAYLGEQP